MYAFIERNTYHTILSSSMLCVTIKCKLERHINTVFPHFLLGTSHIYYSVSYSVSSLRVNQDKEVDSGPKIVLQQMQ
jgi:hypothetical protein